MHGKITAKYMQDDEFQYIFFRYVEKKCYLCICSLEWKAKELNL